MMPFANRFMLLLLCLTTASGLSFGQSLFWYEPEGYLDQVWQHIRVADSNKKTVTILHLGDSHLSGGYFTRSMSAKLAAQYGDKVRFERIGVPGASYSTFSQDKYMQQIKAVEPDLVIISLGTNDSYCFKFSETEMWGNMETFFGMLRQTLEDVPFVLTTPPPSYLRRSVKVAGKNRKGSKRRKNRYRTTYHFNDNTEKASRLIRSYTVEHGMACFDLSAAMGGEAETRQWLRSGLMHTDHIHYTVGGYTRHGGLVADALLGSIVRGKMDRSDQSKL